MRELIEIFNSYKEKADASFKPKLWSEENVLSCAEKAQLDTENIKFLSDFICYADEELKRFMWQFYYMMFESDEDFSGNIWQLEKIPLPEEAEEKFPGAIKACIYLLAAEHLKKWAENTEFNQEELVKSYFQRYKKIVDKNRYSHNTFGLCRLSSFMYGYAYPFILPIGLFTFQYKLQEPFCEVYENEKGEHLLVAVPYYNYDQKGFQSEEGYLPAYELKGDTLLAHTFGEKGKLSLTPETINLKEYKKILCPGDHVVTIHIPGERRLFKEEVKQSIEEAKRLCAKYLPPFKAIVCTTWFIDPNLRGEVILDGSNMAHFADLFDLACARDNKNISIFEHVFETSEQPLENLVPKNDFQKRLVRRALRGEKIYWTFGILKNDI